jgi:phosphoribosylformylglycinamidine synthase
MAALGDMGVDVSVELESSRDIFDESQSRAILEVDEANIDTLLKLADKLGIEATTLGHTNSDSIIKINDLSMELNTLQDTYFNRFAKVIEQDL